MEVPHLTCQITNTEALVAVLDQALDRVLQLTCMACLTNKVYKVHKAVLGHHMAKTITNNTDYPLYKVDKAEALSHVDNITSGV